MSDDTGGAAAPEDDPAETARTEEVTDVPAEKNPAKAPTDEAPPAQEEPQ